MEHLHAICGLLVVFLLVFGCAGPTPPEGQPSAPPASAPASGPAAEPNVTVHAEPEPPSVLPFTPVKLVYALPAD
ncbi:MAG: hypothetical protein PHQ80_04695, partial [Candidatus ainarchaeum sp.]|nr:hypothetical protein [Candidatus ainarchaeum sp.]